MADFMFDQLKKLDKYDTMSQRSKVRPQPRPKPLMNRDFGELEHTQQPLSYEEWLRNQPYGGQISPNIPQGTDYWQELYNDYMAGWQSKFGDNGQGMVGPGSGGPRDMGTPSMGNLLRGKPNKSY
jgi:hypothetical protein